jgi:hypothetical protein
LRFQAQFNIFEQIGTKSQRADLSFNQKMKSLLLIASLALTSAAFAADSSKPESLSGIAPAPGMNAYAAVPEPSHAMLLLLGCVGLAARRRR